MIEFKSLEYLRNIEAIIQSSLQFAGFALVNANAVTENIDRIYASLPSDIQELKKENKNFEIKSDTYNDLKELEVHLDASAVRVFGLYRIVKISEIGLIIHNLYDDMGAVNIY